MKIVKTNAMRILESHNIDYEVYTYEHGKEAVDGLNVAKMLNEDPNWVFKTLITIANTKEYFVFMVPVNHELDLKKAAKAAQVKSIEMIHVKDINKVSGYIRGGCSPIGMKKVFKTFIHEEAILYDYIYFSGGKIGLQIKCDPNNLSQLLDIEFIDIIK